MTQKRLKPISVLCLALLHFMACAGLQVTKPQLENIKSVAVIGFTSSLDLSDPSDINSRPTHVEAAGFGKDAKETAKRQLAQMEEAYASLLTTLGEVWADAGAASDPSLLGITRTYGRRRHRERAGGDD